MHTQFHDVPYHKVLGNREILEAYWWVVRQLNYPEANKLNDSRCLTGLVRRLVGLMTSDGAVKGKSKGKQDGRSREAVWLTVRLRDEDELALSSDTSSPIECLDGLLAFVAEGGSFTIKAHEDGMSFNAFAFYPHDDRVGATYAVSAFAGNAADCLVVLHYKIFHIIGDDPSQFVGSPKRRFG